MYESFFGLSGSGASICFARGLFSFLLFLSFSSWADLYSE